MGNSGGAKREFEKHASGVSYMTPNIMRYGWIFPNKIAYELASGQGLNGEMLYSVTTSRFVVELSVAWLSVEQAELYIKYLRARIAWRLYYKERRK